MFTVAAGGAVNALLLALSARGIGSCWIGSTIFAADTVREVLRTRPGLGAARRDRHRLLRRRHSAASARRHRRAGPGAMSTALHRSAVTALRDWQAPDDAKTRCGTPISRFSTRIPMRACVSRRPDISRPR